MKLIIESWHCVMEQYQFPGVDYMRSRWSKPKVKIQARYVGLSFEEVGLLLNSFDNSSVFDTGVHKDTLVRFRRYADGYPVVDTYTDRQGKSRYNVLIPLCIYDITPDEDINIDDDTVSGLAEKMQEEVDRQLLIEACKDPLGHDLVCGYCGVRERHAENCPTRNRLVPFNQR